MNVNPIHNLHPAFDAWLERRRESMQARLAALEDERYEDLAELITKEEEDQPPEPRDEGEREQYRQLLAEHEEFQDRLQEVRRKLLQELKDVERQQVRGPIAADRYRGLGGTLDGYL